MTRQRQPNVNPTSSGQDMGQGNPYQPPESNQKPANPRRPPSFSIAWRSTPSAKVWLTTLAISAFHWCLLLTLHFAAGGASWASLTHVPIWLLSFPLLWIAEWTGVMRAAPDSIEMVVYSLNSLIWGIAVTCLIKVVRSRRLGRQGPE